MTPSQCAVWFRYYTFQFHMQELSEALQKLQAALSSLLIKLPINLAANARELPVVAQASPRATDPLLQQGHGYDAV
jgi:hypothetical protein